MDDQIFSIIVYALRISLIVGFITFILILITPQPRVLKEYTLYQKVFMGWPEAFGGTIISPEHEHMLEGYRLKMQILSWSVLAVVGLGFIQKQMAQTVISKTKLHLEKNNTQQPAQ